MSCNDALVRNTFVTSSKCSCRSCFRCCRSRSCRLESASSSDCGVGGGVAAAEDDDADDGDNNAAAAAFFFFFFFSSAFSASVPAPDAADNAAAREIKAGVFLPEATFFKLGNKICLSDPRFLAMAPVSAAVVTVVVSSSAAVSPESSSTSASSSTFASATEVSSTASAHAPGASVDRGSSDVEVLGDVGLPAALPVVTPLFLSEARLEEASATMPEKRLAAPDLPLPCLERGSFRTKREFSSMICLPLQIAEDNLAAKASLICLLKIEA